MWKALRIPVRSADQVGQAKRTWCTDIVPVSQGQRGLGVEGMRRWKRNSLKPIIPVLNWIRSALWALLKPVCNLRLAYVTSGVSLAMLQILVLDPQDSFQRFFQRAKRESLICLDMAER